MSEKEGGDRGHTHKKKNKCKEKRPAKPGRRVVYGKKENHWTAEKVKGRVDNTQFLA